MADKLEKTEEAYRILKDYGGNNPYIIDLKNGVYAYKNLTLNSMHIEFILRNHDKELKRVNKTVKVADWWGEKMRDTYNLDFIPSLLFVTWFVGDTDMYYVIYCRYRRSQESDIMMTVPKNAIFTDFLTEDYHNMPLDVSEYEKKSGRTVFEHQKDAIRFLVSRKKCILADEMGGGKTCSAILASLVGNFQHILIVCPSSVKKTWENELKLFVDESEITIVQGSTWKDAKYTIINYDILDNFYKIPTQTIKKRELNVDDGGNVITEVKEKEIVSRSKKIISDAMSESQLYKAEYDLLIIDEAHKLSNSSSGRFKIVYDLVKRTDFKGIFELTGTPITNSSRNFYNILRILGADVTKDWQHYMERYCGAKFFYKKNERNAYTAMFCKSVGKKEWSELTFSEKKELDEVLEKKCKKLCIPGEDTNMEELQEIVKPFYLRRLKSDFADIVKKDIRVLHYQMTEEEKESYDNVWDEYLQIQEDKEKSEKYKKLTEVSILRQWLSDRMIPRTIDLADKCIELGHKVIIFCTFDNEIEKFKEHYGKLSVVHNGKLTEKKKNESVEAFQNDENIKVFIGNIISAGVGLNLVAGDLVIFNSFSFVPGDCKQAEDRIHRLNQTKPCTVYYQSFDGTYFDKMLEIVHNKQEVIDKIIVTEKEK